MNFWELMGTKNIIIISKRNFAEKIEIFLGDYFETDRHINMEKLAFFRQKMRLGIRNL